MLAGEGERAKGSLENRSSLTRVEGGCLGAAQGVHLKTLDLYSLFDSGTREYLQSPVVSQGERREAGQYSGTALSRQASERQTA